MRKCERGANLSGCTSIRLHSWAGRNPISGAKKGKFSGIEPSKRAIAKKALLDKGNRGKRVSREMPAVDERFSEKGQYEKEVCNWWGSIPNFGGKPAIIGEASNCRRRFALIEECFLLAQDRDKVPRNQLANEAAAWKLKPQIIYVPLRLARPQNQSRPVQLILECQCES